MNGIWLETSDYCDEKLRRSPSPFDLEAVLVVLECFGGSDLGYLALESSRETSIGLEGKRSQKAAADATALLKLALYMISIHELLVFYRFARASCIGELTE